MIREHWKCGGLILFIFACYALVGTIDERVARGEAAERPALLSFTIETSADDLPLERIEDVRFAELPLKPERK